MLDEDILVDGLEREEETHDLNPVFLDRAEVVSFQLFPQSVVSSFHRSSLVP
jgi:hypothetical protein